MSFNGMTTYIWAVAKNGLVPVRKYKVTKETEKTYVLEDGTVVRKTIMQNNYVLFFANEEPANTVYRTLREVFDVPESSSNFDIVTNASIDSLPRVLLDMIIELCEDGLPTEETIGDWLQAKPGEL